MPIRSSSGNRIVYANAPGVETDARYNDIFVINADRSGQHEADSYKQNCDCGAVVDISADGNTVVSTDSFELRIASANGSAATQLITNREIPYIRISPTGGKVGYDVLPPPCCSTPNEVGVVNFDGSNRKALATNTADFGSNRRMELNADGSQLLYGSSSYLYATDGSGVLQLSALGGSFSCDKAPLVGEGLFLPTMNSSASRFLYVSKDDAGIPRLATMDINPTALGDAPVITSPALAQAVIALNGSNPSLVTAKVTTANQISRVSAAVLNGGITDPNVTGPVMLDDGTNGDQVAGDGIYTGTISANCCAVLGPRNVRVKPEVRDSGNRRHSTAIEFNGLSVGSTAPSLSER